MDLKKTARRMQQGLAAKGVRVRINQYQHFSTEKNRFSVKYVVAKEEKKGERRYKTILETYRMVDVVKLLAKLLEDTGGDAE